MIKKRLMIKNVSLSVTPKIHWTLNETTKISTWSTVNDIKFTSLRIEIATVNDVPVYQNETHVCFWIRQRVHYFGRSVCLSICKAIVVYSITLTMIGTDVAPARFLLILSHVTKSQDEIKLMILIMGFVQFIWPFCWTLT